jgi:D-arabinono-1,4-lactone oxidase/Protein of unknown function (DUF3892)
MSCGASTFDGVVEPNRVWRNWNGDIEFRPDQYFEPAHSEPDVLDGLAQLVHVAERATREQVGLKAVGACWAFEDLARSDAWTVSPAKLNRQLHGVVDGPAPALTGAWAAVVADPASARRLVHVEAGIRVLDLCELLDGLGLAMPTLGGANGQSLAGVISTSTHGGDWQQPPFPDLVRAVHLVTDAGREVWIERESEPLTTDDRLRPRLTCPDAEIRRDDDLFDAVIVACGRFGVLYSVVLEVRPQFRVVEAVVRPQRAAVMQALRDGLGQSTPFTPLFDLVAAEPVPAGLADATGTPYFFQVLFNSQDPEDVWVHRRWETTDATDLPDPNGPVVGELEPSAIGALVVAGANAALATAVAAATATGVGLPYALYLSGLIAYLDGIVATRQFTLGSAVAAALDTLWKAGLGLAVPGLNHTVVQGEFDRNGATATGRRGKHFRITTGGRASNDQTDYRVDSIEVVFDATTGDYLDFLDDVHAAAPGFQQAGIISCRFSRASRGLLSMHHVAGTHAVSIELATLKNLPGNLDWMRYVQHAAVSRGGRPHWGQYNKMTEAQTTRLYGADLDRWREALLALSGTSTTFSDGFTRRRGLEPMGIGRRVNAVRKTSTGVVTHLCNAEAAWSPVPVATAIEEITSGRAVYFTLAAGSDSPTVIRVVRTGPGTGYLRTAASDARDDNLDELPPC